MFPALHRPRRLHCRTHGGDVETRPGLQRHLRVVGAADPARSLHHGQDRLLEVSEDQRPHIQHHVGRERESERGRETGEEEEEREEGERARGRMNRG